MGTITNLPSSKDFDNRTILPRQTLLDTVGAMVIFVDAHGEDAFGFRILRSNLSVDDAIVLLERVKAGLLER